MAYTKTERDATTYFTKATIRGKSWKNYDQTDRENALVASRRRLELYLNSNAEDPDDDDRYRWDYAIFEYAITLLTFQERQLVSGESKVSTPLRSRKRDASNEDPEMYLPKIVQTYLGINMLKMNRG